MNKADNLSAITWTTSCPCPALPKDCVVVMREDLNGALLRLLSAYTPGGQHKEYGDEDWFNRLKAALEEPK